jgi:uncharacterized protein (DUF1015 family)
MDDAGEKEWKAALEATKESHEIAIGFYYCGAPMFYLLKANSEATIPYLKGKGFEEVLGRLHVVVLDQVILKHLLGLSDGFLADENNIHFKHDSADALSSTRSGEYNAAFLINPTRIDQVQEVASVGLVMPHKSTYFYPKVGSGLVVHPFKTGEEIIW